MRRALIPLLCLFFLLLSFGAVEAKDYVWTKVRVDLTLEKGGTILVEETRSLRFWGNFHYAYIDILKNKISGIDQVSVWEDDRIYREDGSGAPWTFTVVESESLSSIYWYYDYTDTERTFHIKYRILGAPQGGTISYFSDYDQFYFKAIGSEHEKPMQLAEVFIHLPPGAEKESLHLWGYGPDPGTGKVEVLDSQTAYLRAAPLPEGVGIEARLLFPIGLIEKPEGVNRSSSSIMEEIQAEQRAVEQKLRMARILKDIEYIVSILIAVLTPIFLFFLWYFRGREYRFPEGTAMISGPPSELPPAGVEALLRQKVTVKGVVATVFDLAHRGYLGIQEQGKDFLLVFKKKKGGLKHFEFILLNFMFPGRGHMKEGEEYPVLLSSLKKTLGDSIKTIERKVFDYLKRFKLFEGDPQKIRERYTLTFVLTFCVGITLLFLFQVFILGLALTWASFFVLIFGTIMPRRSITGAREASAWKAFKLYMDELISRPQIAQPTQIFSQYLPYAIVFGISKKWTKAMSEKPGFYSPDWWYSGGVGWSAGTSRGSDFTSSFSKAVSDFYSRVSASFSASSSDGGGGFSGGGGGGGGGGGSGAG
ncbi:MAG: DUF2207 domain-containing protein [Caldiserica bacterium]|jgi:uncharacterized membrane protein|nr:DUF2207 domain-containing protein [Caldisericota bacterium]MDH7561833.1 DUF2207 domain-containing protein [Caldisericota bacterium]